MHTNNHKQKTQSINQSINQSTKKQQQTIMSFSDNNVTIGIIGCGFVGTHLIEVLSEKFVTYGFEISEKRVEVLREQFHHKSTTVSFFTSFEHLKTCDCICICVPTPVVQSHLNDTYLRAAIHTIDENIRSEPPVTVIMESSVSIGMTRRMLGFLHDRGHFICMSPERVSPGQMDPKPCDIPKIVSGIDDTSLQNIMNIYSQVFKSVVKVSQLEAAEMCKLFENTFRLLNITFVNQMYDECQRLRINPNEVIRASATKGFGFMTFYPTLYVGGSCIPNNARVLLSTCNMPILEHATEFNERRPYNKASEIVQNYPTANTFLIIGCAFKQGESVTEHSPGLKLAEILQKEFMKKVLVHDPLVTQNEFENADLNNWIFDIVVIAVRQKCIDYDLLTQKCNKHNTPMISFDALQY